MARILIVDDEEMERVLVSSVLGQAGHDLLYAEDGEAALEICRRREVDLVITDLAMPKSSGLRLIREIQELRIDVPVIAISGRAKDQLDLAESYGARSTLFKPVDGQDLLNAVGQVLSAPVDDPWKYRR